MIKVYEKRFNDKINHFKNHPHYGILRKSADEAIRYHTGYGLDAIHAQDFMNRIIKMPLQYIQEWLDGNNALEWIDKNTQRNYDSIHITEVLNNPIQ